MDAEQDTKRRTRGRPSPEQVELIENELLTAALTHFVRDGYGGTSIGKIVKSLGISKTTVYSRYPSKAKLFEAIMSRQIDGLSVETVLHVIGGHQKLEDGLQAYAVRTLEISLEGDLLQVNRLIYSESGRFPELGIAAAQRTEFGIRQIAKFIAECAVQDGVPCQDPKGVAGTFIFTLRGWYVNVMLTNEPVSKAAIARFAAQTVHTLLSGRAGW